MNKGDGSFFKVYRNPGQTELGPVDILLYSIINNYWEADSKCFISNSALAKEINVSRPTIINSIRKLKELNLIDTEFGKRNRRLIVKPTYDNMSHCKDMDACDNFTPPCKNTDGYCKNTIHPSYKNTIKINTVDTPNSGRGVSDLVTNIAQTEPPPETEASMNTTKNNFGLVKEISNSKPLGFDTKCATKLLEASRNYLGPSHYSIRKARISIWAKQFQLMRTQDGHPKKLIRETLIWYMKNLGGEFIPQAFSAKSFRQKFHAIEMAKEKDILGMVDEHPKLYMVLPHLEMLGWPKNASQDLATAISASLLSYTTWTAEFYQRIKLIDTPELKEKLGHQHKCDVQLAHHLQARFAEPAAFVIKWFIDVHRRVHGWADWNGDLAREVFKPDSRTWQNWLATEAERYGGDRNAWKKLDKTIKLYGKGSVE